MEESEDNMSAEEIKLDDVPIKVKPKKRSLVERELETSLTARITSPLTNEDAKSRSRYGRARRLKSDTEFCDLEKNVSKLKSPKVDKSPSKTQSPAYKMHASNSPVRIETPKRDSSLENQIENIYNENISLSRFNSEEKACKSATKKFPKVYIRKDLIQSKDKDDDAVVLIKNMFSPSKSAKKPNTHLSNYLERSSEKYNMRTSMNSGYLNTSSVVKTLDFDGKKKKKEEKKAVLSKSELFDMEAQSEYQVGDLTWARMGTYPFWPCIITRDPFTGMFVKKKLFGRIERDVLHVTFFGDNGRRGWIVGSMLRKFLGQTEFEATRANFPPETKKRDPRLYSAFFISDKKLSQWQVSVDEAEMLLREPKRLRIDILNDMLQRVREIKTTPKHEKSKAIVRTNSDVSLSESLLDTLFSEDDSKVNDADRSRSKSRNRSFDVSEVVTACLDNMAAKTGITKIQRQSHMDRWLQKAKSKTPEKSHFKSHLSLKIEKDNKVSNPAKLKKKLPKKSPPNKPYNFRKIVSENKLLPHQNEHDYSLRYHENNGPVLLDNIEIEYENAEMLTSDVIEPGSGLGVISKVETLCGKEQVDNNDQNDVIMTVVNEEFIITDANNIPNMDIANGIYIQNNHGQLLDVNKKEVLDKENETINFMEINSKIEPNKVDNSETVKVNNIEEYDDHNLETLSVNNTKNAYVVTAKDSDCNISCKNILGDTCIDNECSDVYESQVQTTNNQSDNDRAIVDQNISLKDVTKMTAIVTDEQNNSVIDIEGTDSIMDQERHLNNVNKLNSKSVTLDVTSNSIDKYVLEQVIPEKESVLKEHLLQNKELESNIFSEISTLSNVVNSKDNGLKEIPNEQTEIKESLLKKLESNSSTEKKLSTSSTISSEVLNVADKEFDDFPEKSFNILDKNNLKQTTPDKEIVKKENLALNKEFNTNSAISGNNLTKAITLNSEGSNIVKLKKCGTEDFLDVSKNIEEKTPMTHGILNKETITKEDIHLNKDLKSESSADKELTSSSTQNLGVSSLEVSNSKEYSNDGIEDFPDKTIEEKTTEQATPYEDIVKKNVCPNKELQLKNLNTGNKTAYCYTKNQKVQNVISKECAEDGIKDFTEMSTNIGKKNLMLETKSLQNDHELKEFETQLYSIFGLTNKKSPKSKLNLSLKKPNTTDEIKTIDKVSQNESDNGLECTENIFCRNAQENKFSKSVENKNSYALVSVKKNGLVERELSEQKEQSKDILVNIESEMLIEPKVSDMAGNDITAKETQEQNFQTAFDVVIQTSAEEAVNANVLNKADLLKEPDGESVKVAQNMMDVDNNMKEKNTASSEVESSPQKINLPSDRKLSYDCKEALKNTDFVKYLELRQDALMDEQPELTEVEITNYLYKTWMYEESLKTDIKKTDDKQNATLVNGLKYSPIKIKLSLDKSSKKNRKSYNVQITNDNESNDNPSVCLSEKKMKTVLKKINKNNKDDGVNQKKSSPKRSKHMKRNKHYNNSFQKYFISSIKKDSYSNNVLELIPKECQIQEKDNCQIKVEIDAREDGTRDDFAMVSSKSPIQNGYNNVQIDKKLHSSNKTDCVENLSLKVSELVTQNGCHEGKLNSESSSLDGFDADTNSVCDDDEPLADQQLRLTFSKKRSACVADGAIIMKNNTDIKEESEDDIDNVSVKSERSEVSFVTDNLSTKDKLSSDKRKPLEEPEFLQYLELKQDTIIDEHPELTADEITSYLYKTWLYEESLKNNIKKEDDIETVTNLVKGLNQNVAQAKKVRKKRVEKDKQIEINLDSEGLTRKEKSKRKIIKPYFYKEHFSDIEDDIEFFEIFKPKSKTPTPVSVSELQSSDIQMIDAEVEAEFATNEIDEVEEYFRQLTVPKPNLFKGLLREKVCEICFKVDNLIKCKGCHCMFHVDCVRRKPEVVETVTTVRGRKKKKKTRGRKAKDHSNSLDSECQSDEKSQDPNASDEMQNTSMENKIEPYVIANADDFEAQLSVKMKELLENPESKECDSFSSAEELDWNDIDYGECKIVDVLPRKRDREFDIDHANFKCDNCKQYDKPVCFVCKSAVSPKVKAEHRQRCQVAHCHKYYHSECLDHWPQTHFNAGELSRINNSNQLVEALTCPRHVCHTCVCDDPRGCKTRFSGDKLARCVKCPATYHTFTKCLPAGTQILTASHIICPRHYEHRPGKVPCHVNTGWCFICALGGTLICCEYCPTSFHAECLNIDPPEGGYMCEDCETGRLPLYGEMVWVKLGHYRWWPGLILHPSEIPPNILAVKHLQGEFVVRFFGQYDYYWVNRGRVFPFQEGDSGRISGQKSKIDAAFTMAMEHAQRACEVLKTAPPNEEESMDIASSLLPPHYVKLRVNKPCGSLCGKKIDIEESSLTQCECDPAEYDPCGPYTQCLNRMLLTECGPTCRAGDRCNNRAFEKRLYPKMTPYRTPHRGWGLKTLEDIKAGQFVIEYVGELIDEEEFRRRMRRKQEVRDENFYYLTLDKERMIDAGPKGNLARFMNHSCEPNCETQKWTVLGDVRVGLFALYDIPANSELTFNYNLESTGIEKKQCMCGAKRCSGYIGEKPKQDDQPKKNKMMPQTKRTYKKRKNPEISPIPKTAKQRVPRPYRPRELTEIEKDLLIIKNATNGVSSDSESSRLSVDSKESKGLKRRRMEETGSPSTKKFKTDKLTEATQDSDIKYQEVSTA